MSATVDIAGTQAKLPTDLVEKPSAWWHTPYVYRWVLSWEGVFQLAAATVTFDDVDGSTVIDGYVEELVGVWVSGTLFTVFETVCNDFSSFRVE